MASFNQITVQGNIGNAEELKILPNGTQVLRFSVAANSGYGEKKKTVWFRATLFGKQAASLQSFLFKGKNVLIMGEFSNSEWTAKDGTLKFSNEIKVEKVVLQGSKDDHQDRHEAPAEESAQNEEQLPGTDVPF